MDDIAHTCEVARFELNVVSIRGSMFSRLMTQIASPKGLVAGLQSGNNETSTIPTSDFSFDQVRWILVVEKEVGTSL